MIRFRLYIFLTVLLVAAAEDSRAQRPAVGYVSLTDQIERLERALGTTSGARRNTTLLELAQAHYELGRFYTLVWQTTVRINEVYFSIMEEQNRDAGPAAMLFRGIGYYEIGENDKARDMFSRFLSTGGSTVQRLQSDAFAWMGAAWYMDNNRQQAIQQWSKIPEQYDCSVLMYVYSRTGYNLDARLSIDVSDSIRAMIRTPIIVSRRILQRADMPIFRVCYAVRNSILHIYFMKEATGR
jgi:tetratricopeptide (TPR) repeat protein